MGHYFTTVRGEGKDRRAAQSDAVSKFLQEEGSRHSVREVLHPKLLKRVAPWGVTRIEHDSRGKVTVTDGTRRNEAAPQSEWNELWEFELHTHA